MDYAKKKIVMWSVCLASGLAASANADILYDATDFNTSGGVYANNYYPDHPTSGSYLAVDDIAVGAGGWTIDTVSVWGGQLLGDSDTTTEAYLTVYSKSLGFVNPLDHATVVTVTQTPEDFTDPGGIPSTRTLQRFDVSGLGLTLSEGEYWIGLTPILAGSNPFGAWSSHTDQGDSPMQYKVETNEWFTLGGDFTNWGPDMMMRIQGSPAPAPGAAMMAPVAMLVLGRRRRRG